ncbi:hypothetical protein QYF61_000396 [Mycteria americana]|uniref:Uncharacterized protein n=1 Tax=Mycteria americana TaxID=33587 RepID=A0AAN7RJW6_MYCAM|nr:hypothetical protein QYF61_000396 [Mycteria americana]
MGHFSRFPSPHPTGGGWVALQLNQGTNLWWYQSPLYTGRNLGSESQLVQKGTMKEQGHHEERRRKRKNS